MEQAERHPVIVEHLSEGFLGALQSPRGRDHSSILSRIRVADHHFLLSSSCFELPAINGIIEQRPHHSRSASEIFERLEQRNDVETRDRLLAAESNQSRLTGEQQHL